MNRTTLLSSLVFLLLTALASANSPAPASAPFNARQVVWCSSGCYTVKIDASLTCSPSVRTSWNSGAVVWPAPLSSFYAPGTTTIVCPMPVQPVGTLLDWVNVCGTVLPGLQGQYPIPAGAGGCGCPALCVQICSGSSGCLTVFVSPASACTAPPLLCL